MAQPGEPAQVEIAVLKNDIKHISDTMNRLEGKFDLALGTFVPLDKLVDAQKSSEVKHIEIDARLDKLESWITWATRGLLIAILTAALTFIVYLLVAKFK